MSKAGYNAIKGLGVILADHPRKRVMMLFKVKSKQFMILLYLH